MSHSGYCFFDTALGRCAVAWGPQGLRALQLPGLDEAAARARLQRRAPGAEEAPPDGQARAAIAGVCALFSGEAADLSALVLDLRGVPPLYQRIYAAARAIPCGQTTSYGRLAEQLGDRSLARAVGQAMASNPFPPVVPCHRVLAAHGRPGGFSAPGGLQTKITLLQIEGARLSEEADLFAHDAKH